MKNIIFCNLCICIYQILGVTLRIIFTSTYIKQFSILLQLNSPTREFKYLPRKCSKLLTRYSTSEWRRNFKRSLKSHFILYLNRKLVKLSEIVRTLNHEDCEHGVMRRVFESEDKNSSVTLYFVRILHCYCMMWTR